VIVRDRGDSWQVVLQTDHADLSAGFARAWAERGPRHDSLVLATERHDDGWAVWEQAPSIDREIGKPINFLDVQVPAHLAFYRACITAVSDQDAYAGLLVSMHGSGIYRHRYGTQPELQLSHADDVKELVDTFVAEQEEAYPARMTAAGVSDDERWADYHRLQVYDRLSLYFCLKDVEAGEADDVAGYRLEPLGAWRVRMEPFPFRESPARFSLLRRVLPKRSRTEEDFSEEFPALAPERMGISIEAGQG
jgi:uncharacterized protein DUF3891